MLFVSLAAAVLLAGASSSASTSVAATPFARPRSAPPERFRIPLTKRHVEKTPETFLRRAEALKRKYGAPVRSRKQRRATGTVSLTNYQNSEYYGTISVGTPSQEYSVVLDTGSADLVLAVDPCSGCDTDTPTYDPSSSSSSQTSTTPFSIQFGSGAASGTLAQDTVSIGGFTIAKQVFGACDQLDNLVDGSISGLLGLALQGLAVSKATPLVQAIAETGALSAQVFSFAFTGGGATYANQVTPGGTMTIGAVDTSEYSGSINYVTTTTSTYWAIPLQGVSAGGQSLGVTSNAAVIDTGTTLIAMPPSAADAIYSQINGQEVQLEGESGYYAFPCSESPQISLEFGGVSYPISSDNFNVGSLSSSNTGLSDNLCLGAIFAVTGGNVDYIIGDAFLQGVYTAFRFSPGPAVGFASLGSGGTSSSSASSSSASTTSSTSSSTSSIGLSTLTLSSVTSTIPTTVALSTSVLESTASPNFSSVFTFPVSGTSTSSSSPSSTSTSSSIDPSTMTVMSTAQIVTVFSSASAAAADSPSTSATPTPTKSSAPPQLAVATTGFAVTLLLGVYLSQTLVV